MKRSATVRGLVCYQVCLIFGGMLGAVMCCAVTEGADARKPAVSETAQRLVDEARQAKIAGEASRQFALLRQAVGIAPDYELARWQLGQVKADDEWVAVEEAQRRAAANPKQAQYRELRTAHGETPVGQLALARWCRKNELDDEAKFHWASVLSVDPTNKEALSALDMQWFGGHLLTREEIAEQRTRQQESKRAAKKWAPKIAKWQRDVWGSDPAKREEALQEIRTLKSIDAIYALEPVALGEKSASEKNIKQSTEISLAALDALQAIDEQTAAALVIRYAVFSPVPEVRAAAAEKLKPRAQQEYVPLLLSGLRMPLESSFTVRYTADGSAHYQHSLFREGQNSDWEVDARHSLVQNDRGGRHIIVDRVKNKVFVGPPNSARPSELAKRANIASTYVDVYSDVAAVTEMKVAQVNERTEALNARLNEALAGATGKRFDSPREWWDWWRDHNEYYASDDRPVERQYYSDTDSYYSGGNSYEVRLPPPPPRPNMSCFAKGTPVWTKTGQRAIESLELGDLVLAQNVATGELAFKPIIARTVRPPSEILKLSLDGDEVRTTLGHPFWVAGVGWRMAKQLEDGAILHGVTGAPRLKSVDKSDQEEAYNLVVADFNTYFVGESGVLVHDNTPRRPTRAALPGLAAKQ